ncbi:unnamed protein product, partial [marine sediment metagenome]
MQKVFLGQPFELTESKRKSPTYVIPLHSRKGSGVGFVIIDRYAMNMRVTMRKAYSRSRHHYDFPAKEIGIWLAPSLRKMG